MRKITYPTATARYLRATQRHKVAAAAERRLRAARQEAWNALPADERVILEAKDS